MNITEIKSEIAGDSYYKVEHPSGLTIFVYPKEGYTSSYAIFGTRYGSINTKFSVNGGDIITVPDGIAHYLEHKLFESEEGDAFVRYAKTGANANAYTSFEKTCYLFSCTDKFDESLEILLDFVQDPYFTAQTVAKEQGIIGQEIKMYDDSPDWRVMFNMLEGMYHNHPVKIDIAGTVETIAEITAEKLYEVYNVFYNLNNMILCVAGNVTVDGVFKVADKMLKPCEKKEIKTILKQSLMKSKNLMLSRLSLFQCLCSILASKKADKPLNEKQLACTDILLSALASNTSMLYRNLMDSNLINSSFSYELFEGPGYCSVIFGGESRAPKQAAEMIKQYISDIKKNGIDKEDFEIARKSVYGDSVSSLNSVSAISNSIIDYAMQGNEIFAYIDAVANAKLEDINARFAEMLDVDNCTLSVVKQPEEV